MSVVSTSPFHTFHLVPVYFLPVGHLCLFLPNDPRVDSSRPSFGTILLTSYHVHMVLLCTVLAVAIMTEDLFHLLD